MVLLKKDGKEITEDESIAQEMNLYFLSVFTQEQSNLPRIWQHNKRQIEHHSRGYQRSGKTPENTLNAHKSPQGQI